jgi:hypothetical protein
LPTARTQGVQANVHFSVLPCAGNLLKQTLNVSLKALMQCLIHNRQPRNLLTSN